MPDKRPHPVGLFPPALPQLHPVALGSGVGCRSTASLVATRGASHEGPHYCTSASMRSWVSRDPKLIFANQVVQEVTRDFELRIVPAPLGRRYMRIS